MTRDAKRLTGSLGPVVVPVEVAPMPPVLSGRYARLERLSRAHVPGLWNAYAEDREGSVWIYMAEGPFADQDAFAAWVDAAVAGATGVGEAAFYAIKDRDAGRLGGVAAFLAIRPGQRVIEVGAIALAPCLQRRRAATEAMALMAGWAFGAGYRRYEWKCNALNAPSRRAAARLGFSYEGVFRCHMIQKGRSRDTAWFAMTQSEWPGLAGAHAAWLDPGNFDAAGWQRRQLGTLTAPWRRPPHPEA
ncbi:GNAT family protein [soil metagenome]